MGTNPYAQPQFDSQSIPLTQSSTIPATPPPCPPSQPSHPQSHLGSTQRGSAPSPRPTTPGTGHSLGDATRVYGFDLNDQWQGDHDHYDNQKINGLTFPKVIRASQFTSKLDIEGCDPLHLPLAALLYQQANNFWLRKLAHGRELYLIPTSDLATVVFAAELLSQLRNRGIDLDKVAQVRARQDNQTLDKTANTKYAAKLIAEHIQEWVPVRATDPSSHQMIVRLQNEISQLRQKRGLSPDEASTPEATTLARSSHEAITPIERALRGTPGPPSAPSFDPACLLSVPGTPNSWLEGHLHATLAERAFNQWVKSIKASLSESQRGTLERNLQKTMEWWQNQP